MIIGEGYRVEWVDTEKGPGSFETDDLVQASEKFCRAREKKSVVWAAIKRVHTMQVYRGHSAGAPSPL